MAGRFGGVGTRRGYDHGPAGPGWRPPLEALERHKGRSPLRTERVRTHTRHTGECAFDACLTEGSYPDLGFLRPNTDSLLGEIMSVKRLLTVCLAFAITFSGLSCSDAADPVSLVEPQYGKPIKPPPSAPVELLEYYIYKEGGKNYVHIVATGNVPMVNLNVVQDYFFNGIRDDDYSIFYEYTTSAPDPVSMADLLAKDLVEIDPISGAWHIDLPWDGETWYRDYDLEGYPRFETHFPNFPHTGLDGAGADPYAFAVHFQKENGDAIKWFQPQGIILGGEEQYVPVLDQPTDDAFHATVGTIYSYATYAGSTPGTSIFIDQLSFDPGSLSCSVKTIREGRGKNASTRTVTEVSVTTQVILHPLINDLPPDAWIDVMFALANDGEDGPVLLDSFISTHGSTSWASGWTVSAQFEGDQPISELRLAVPYVYATDLQNQMVYDPAKNTSFTNPSAGWTTINAGPISAPGSFPIAITKPFSVDCGK